MTQTATKEYWVESDSKSTMDLVRQIAKDFNLSEEQLAEKMGIKHSYFKILQSKKEGVSLKHLDKLCENMGLEAIIHLHKTNENASR